MSMSYFVPNTSESLTWSSTHAPLDPTNWAGNKRNIITVNESETDLELLTRDALLTRILGSNFGYVYWTGTETILLQPFPVNNILSFYNNDLSAGDETTTTVSTYSLVQHSTLQRGVAVNPTNNTNYMLSKDNTATRTEYTSFLQPTLDDKVFCVSFEVVTEPNDGGFFILTNEYDGTNNVSTHLSDYLILYLSSSSTLCGTVDVSKSSGYDRYSPSTASYSAGAGSLQGKHITIFINWQAEVWEDLIRIYFDDTQEHNKGPLASSGMDYMLHTATMRLQSDLTAGFRVSGGATVDYRFNTFQHLYNEVISSGTNIQAYINDLQTAGYTIQYLNVGGSRVIPIA